MVNRFLFLLLFTCFKANIFAQTDNSKVKCAIVDKIFSNLVQTNDCGYILLLADTRQHRVQVALVSAMPSFVIYSKKEYDDSLAISGFLRKTHLPACVSLAAKTFRQ